MYLILCHFILFYFIFYYPRPPLPPGTDYEIIRPPVHGVELCTPLLTITKLANCGTGGWTRCQENKILVRRELSNHFYVSFDQ